MITSPDYSGFPHTEACIASSSRVLGRNLTVHPTDELPHWTGTGNADSRIAWSGREYGLLHSSPKPSSMNNRGYYGGTWFLHPLILRLNRRQYYVGVLETPVIRASVGLQ